MIEIESEKNNHSRGKQTETILLIVLGIATLYAFLSPYMLTGFKPNDAQRGERTALQRYSKATEAPFFSSGFPISGDTVLRLAGKNKIYSFLPGRGIQDSLMLNADGSINGNKKLLLPFRDLIAARQVTNSQEIASLIGGEPVKDPDKDQDVLIAAVIRQQLEKNTTPSELIIQHGKLHFLTAADFRCDWIDMGYYHQSLEKIQAQLKGTVTARIKDTSQVFLPRTFRFSGIPAITFIRLDRDGKKLYIGNQTFDTSTQATAVLQALGIREPVSETNAPAIATKFFDQEITGKLQKTPNVSPAQQLLNELTRLLSNKADIHFLLKDKWWSGNKRPESVVLYGTITKDGLQTAKSELVSELNAAAPGFNWGWLTLIMLALGLIYKFRQTIRAKWLSRPDGAGAGDTSRPDGAGAGDTPVNASGAVTFLTFFHRMTAGWRKSKTDPGKDTHHVTTDEATADQSAAITAPAATTNEEEKTTATGTAALSGELQFKLDQFDQIVNAKNEPALLAALARLRTEYPQIPSVTLASKTTVLTVELQVKLDQFDQLVTAKDETALLTALAHLRTGHPQFPMLTTVSGKFEELLPKAEDEKEQLSLLLDWYQTYNEDRNYPDVQLYIQHLLTQEDLVIKLKADHLKTTQALEQQLQAKDKELTHEKQRQERLLAEQTKKLTDEIRLLSEVGEKHKGRHKKEFEELQTLYRQGKEKVAHTERQLQAEKTNGATLEKRLKELQLESKKLSQLFVAPPEPDALYQHLRTKIIQAENQQTPENLIGFVQLFSSGPQTRFNSYEKLFEKEILTSNLISKYTDDLALCNAVGDSRQELNVLDRTAVLFLSLRLGQDLAGISLGKQVDFRPEIIRSEQLQLVYFTNYFLNSAQKGERVPTVLSQIADRVAGYNLRLGTDLFPKVPEDQLKVLDGLLAQLIKHRADQRFFEKLHQFFVADFAGKVQKLRFGPDGLEDADYDWLQEMMFHITFHAADYTAYAVTGGDISNYKNCVFLLNDLDLQQTAHREFIENSMDQSSNLPNIVVKAARKAHVKRLRLLLDDFYIQPQQI